MRRAMAATRSLSPFPSFFKPKHTIFPQHSSSFFFPFPQTLTKSPLKTTPKPLCTHSLPSKTLTPSPLPPSSPLYYLDLEPYLKCSMPGERLRVAVLVSGGVDSSVALRLLHAAGHSVSAFYLKIWFQEDFENFWSACPWDEDLRFAAAVCEKVDVPLQVVHLTDEYWNNVVSYMIDEYRSGHTPNPDVLCNTRIKFGAFLEAVESMKFDYIASGHYAHVTHSSSDREKMPSILSLSKDMVKFSEFVAKHIGEMEGILLEAETGDYLGNHKGFWFHTIGQRQGLGLPGGPWYVVEKDVHDNVIFVSRHYHSFDKRRRTFRVGSPKWISGSPPKNNQLRCKVRHGPSFHDCSITTKLDDDSCGEVVTVHLSEDDQGLAAGQYAAFYDDEVCVGSGVILDSRDDKSFPICDKALEIARLKDKSKLGKSVRIMNL